MPYHYMQVTIIPVICHYLWQAGVRAKSNVHTATDTIPVVILDRVVILTL